MSAFEKAQGVQNIISPFEISELKSISGSKEDIINSLNDDLDDFENKGITITNVCFFIVSSK